MRTLTTITRYVYSAFFYLLVPFILLRLLWRSRRNIGYRKRIAERFGFFKAAHAQSIWIHSVSVGESLIAVALVKKLRQTYPDMPIVVTTMTPTGSARIVAGLGDSVTHVYVPYDLPDVLHRFLKRVNPKVAIMIETELWPNLFAICQQRDIPLLIANGRLSPKSAQGYRRMGWLTREMLERVQLLLTQGKGDAERFIQLGMDPDKVVVTGNIKFDLELPADLKPRAEVLRLHLGEKRLIWVAASTHAGEEEKVLQAHALIRAQVPDALLVLVPRHPERFTPVAELVAQHGFAVARRSRGEDCQRETAVYLGDTMGELLLLYAATDVAFVGGSFIAIGGHNLLEPAALSKPVISGPQLFNFTEISELLTQAGALVKVEDAQGLAQAVNGLFADSLVRQTMGEKGRKVVEANRGAMAKHVDYIARALS